MVYRLVYGIQAQGRIQDLLMNNKMSGVLSACVQKNKAFGQKRGL